MKNPLFKLFTALLIAIPVTTTQAQTQIPPAATVFNGATGRLQIPQMLFNGKSYYLELSLVDAAALTMKIDTRKLVDVTPTASTTGKTPADIVGTWKLEGSATTLTMNSDATFRVVQAKDAGCPVAGVETGTFGYTASTGVFMPIFLTDETGDCGLSGDGPILIFTDGNAMKLRFAGEGVAFHNLSLVK